MKTYVITCTKPNVKFELDGYTRAEVVREAIPMAKHLYFLDTKVISIKLKK